MFWTISQMPNFSGEKNCKDETLTDGNVTKFLTEIAKDFNTQTMQ